jgi:uncharacterized protein YacL
MDTIIIILLVIIMAESTFLTYRAVRRGVSTSGSDILLDTSVLIDGRILAIARSGLVSARLIVPRSVVRELQFMADKADHDKRERARYGLEVIEKLQQLPNMELLITDDGATSEHGVDEQLILLAQRTGAKLCTIDYNLNKAARVQSVEIVNINELAHALRIIHLPGEKISVELVQPGQDKKQAVGYLDDGTMVVVEDARELMGQTVPIELTRVLQTAAGRMMFARKISSAQTRGEAKGRGRMSTNKEAFSKAPAEPKGRRETATVSSTSQEKKSRTQPVRRNRRRQTPEDTLVDLANK